MLFSFPSCAALGGKCCGPATIGAEGCHGVGRSCSDTKELVHDGSNMASLVLSHEWRAAIDCRQWWFSIVNKSYYVQLNLEIAASCLILKSSKWEALYMNVYQRIGSIND